MFTGLIETIGLVHSVETKQSSALIGIKPGMNTFDVNPGASVAVNGACLTLEYCRGDVLFFTAVHETLTRTTLGSLTAGTRVNLERALLATSRFDGHMVLGHVDGVGTIIRDVQEGVSLRRTIKVPNSCAVFIAEKGSVAVDGISLTVATVQECEITVAFIPKTLEVTTMSRKKVGDQVNIECDVIARYIYRIVQSRSGLGNSQVKETLIQKLERAGF